MGRRGRIAGLVALWSSGILFVPVILFVLAVWIGLWWVENSYLQRELRFGDDGEHIVRVHGAEVSWRLNVRADSLWYRGPAAEVRLGATDAAIDWIGGIRNLNPSARVKSDSLHARLLARDTIDATALPDEDAATKGPPAFPDFSIPLGVDVSLAALQVVDDSGHLAGARDIRLVSPGGIRARLDADAIVTRWNAHLPADVRVGLDWGRADSVTLRGEVERGEDRLRLFARHAKDDLRQGRDSVTAEIADLSPWLAALGIADDNLPRITGLRLDGSARPGEVTQARVRIRAKADSWVVTEQLTLGPQALEAVLDWRGKGGNLRLQSRGEEGEDVLLAADARLLNIPEDRDSVAPWERATLTVRGHARNLMVNVRDTLRAADAVIERADWDGRELAVRLVTGDLSRIEADGRSDPATNEWHASFAADIDPEERWLRVFTGESITFDGLRVRGVVNGPNIEASLDAEEVVAWDVAIDSLRSLHAYGPQGYVLRPSMLHARGIAWEASGRVDLPAPEGSGPALSFTLGSPAHGSVRYAQHPDGTMEVEADAFRPVGLPHEALDSLPVVDPVISGTFRWNRTLSSGEADVAARARYDGDPVDARVDAVWDPETLTVRTASAGWRGSELNAAATVRLHGREFFDLSGVTIDEITRAALEVPRLDVSTVFALLEDILPEGLPFDPAEILPVDDPVVQASFAWDDSGNSGRVDVHVEARHEGDLLRGSLAGHWNPEHLIVAPLRVEGRGSEAAMHAMLRIDGRRIHEITGIKPGDIASLGLEIPRLDVADILSIFLNDSPLASGVLEGRFDWSDSAGFGGELEARDVRQRVPTGNITLEELMLQGFGDTLRVTARTLSPSTPLLNAGIEASLTGALADSQTVRLVATADGMRAELTGVMRDFASLRGTLTAEGRADLPDGAGAIEEFAAELEFDLPFGDVIGGGTLGTRTFGGLYVLPGLPAQRFSLDAVLRDGALRVPALRIVNDEGQTLDGNAAYVFADNSLEARAAGARFLAQWGDDARADLRTIDLRFRMDSTGMRAEGTVGEGLVRFADPPLRAEGRVTNLRFDFDQPANGARAAGVPAGTAARDGNPGMLNLSATLNESLVRYRLRSFGDIQRLVRGDRRQRSGAGQRGRDQSTLPRMNIRLQTIGTNNRIDTDALRLTWTGDIEARGGGPFTLLNGRVNALEGSFGLERQAYTIRELEVRWLNAPVEEGVIAFEGRRTLAASCRPTRETADATCTVIARLDGELDDMQFSYDSDCGGAFGAGASVTALLYSMQRGCYDPSFATGEARYGEAALSLLEPQASRLFTRGAEQITAGWIERVDITGLGALSREQSYADTLGEPVSIGLTSREYLRLRLQLRGGYHVESQDLSNPWERMLAIEWRPPVENLARDETWNNRLRDNLRVVASVQTRPRRRNDPREEEIERKVGLNYNHFFWGEWWDRTRRTGSDE